MAKPETVWRFITAAVVVIVVVLWLLGVVDWGVVLAVCLLGAVGILTTAVEGRRRREPPRPPNP
ncbi:hypothetical protein [uncultured Pseudokineococcus sp.]|uniref:hypothetical protein n=1 Tax=uncultured Pseudokineococcus sp. TaxID=1642928 RepID=UPI00262CDE9E|nr:hypothetical protein [uncultured Pseudokineococcus sp.]